MIELINVQGHDLRVAFTPGDGVPLVLCNGWGANIETFEPLIASLGERPILRFDVPGIGGSTLPRWPLRMPALAQLVETLWQRYEFRQVDVAGYSWGGALAQELARRNPRMVRKLVLIATTSGHFMVPASPRILPAFASWRWLPTLARPSRLFERDFMCHLGPRLFGGEALRRNPMALLPNLRQLEQPSVKAMAWQVAALSGWTSLTWLTKLPQPTLILAGTDDRVVNALNPVLLRRLIPDARLRWINGGHLFPVLDAPTTTGKLISEFLDAHPKVVPIARRRKQPARRAG